MSNDLVNPDDLDDFPGAPFSDSVVDAAVEAIRGVAGWHIGGEREETVTVDARGGSLLRLPSLLVTDVAEIRDVTVTSDPVVLTDWRASMRGLVTRSCWPYGIAVVEADITHGYETCPADLLPIIAAYCRNLPANERVTQESAGPFSKTVSTDSDPDGVLARYTIPWGIA